MSQAEQSAAARLMAVGVRLHCAEKAIEQHLDLISRLTRMVDKVIPDAPCGCQTTASRAKVSRKHNLKVIRTAP